VLLALLAFVALLALALLVCLRQTKRPALLHRNAANGRFECLARPDGIVRLQTAQLQRGLKTSAPANRYPLVRQRYAARLQ
jgi:hypothetical protein